MRRILITTLLLGAGLAVLLLVWTPGRRPKRRGAERAGAVEARDTETARARTDPVRQGIGLVAGDVVRYDVELATAIRVYAPAGSVNATVRRTQGTLTVRVYERRGDATVAGFAFSGGLDGEVLVRIEADGSTGAPDFPETMATQARLSFLDVLSVWRVVLPRDTEARSWSTLETDRTGRFAARYVRDSNQEITRYKDEYVERSGPESADVTVHVEGKAQCVLDPFLERCEGGERRWTTDRRSGRRVEEETRFSCTLVGHERVDRRQLEAQRTPRARVVFENIDTIELDAGEVRRRVLELLRELDTTDRLVALLSRFDAAADVVLARITDPACEDPMTLAQALGRAATPAAERALVALLARRPAIATAVLGSMLRPSDATVDALVRAHRAGAEGALEALARIGHRAKDRDAPRYESVCALLVEALESATTNRVAVVRAAWALKPRKVPEALRALATHENADVRVATVMAFGFCDDPAATALLRGALREDDSDVVRQAAILALLERRSLRPDSAAAVGEILAEVAARDRSEALRRLATRNRAGSR